MKVIDELAASRFSDLFRYVQLHPISKQDKSLHANSMTESCTFATDVELLAAPVGPQRRNGMHLSSTMSHVGSPGWTSRFASATPQFAPHRLEPGTEGQASPEGILSREVEDRRSDRCPILKYLNGAASSDYLATRVIISY